MCVSVCFGDQWVGLQAALHSDLDLMLYCRHIQAPYHCPPHISSRRFFKCLLDIKNLLNVATFCWRVKVSVSGIKAGYGRCCRVTLPDYLIICELAL